MIDEILDFVSTIVPDVVPPLQVAEAEAAETPGFHVSCKNRAQTQQSETGAIDHACDRQPSRTPPACPQARTRVRRRGTLAAESLEVAPLKGGGRQGRATRPRTADLAHRRRRLSPKLATPQLASCKGCRELLENQEQRLAANGWLDRGTSIQSASRAAVLERSAVHGFAMVSGLRRPSRSDMIDGILKPPTAAERRNRHSSGYSSPGAHLPADRAGRFRNHPRRCENYVPSGALVSNTIWCAPLDIAPVLNGATPDHRWHRCRKPRMAPANSARADLSA